jgi:hypothetical protein
VTTVPDVIEPIVGEDVGFSASIEHKEPELKALVEFHSFRQIFNKLVCAVIRL